HQLVSQPLEQGLNEDDEPLTQDRHRATPSEPNRRPNKNGPQGPSRKTKSPSGGFGSQALGPFSPRPNGRGPRGRAFYPNRAGSETQKMATDSPELART